MARYADIDKLIADGWHLERHGQSGRFLQSMSLADVPTVDVVDTVRCKNCIHFEYPMICNLRKVKVVVARTDYCSYGKRKGE